MFYEHRHKIFACLLFMFGTIFGWLQPWSILQKREYPLIFQLADVRTIESTMYVTATIIDQSNSFDSSEIMADLSFQTDEEHIAGQVTYDEERREVAATFELDAVQGKDFILVYTYKGFEYTLQTYEAHPVEYPEGRLSLGYVEKWDTVVFAQQKVLEVDNYNAVQETVQKDKKIRYRVSDYFYDEATKTATIAITTTKSGARIIAGFTDNHETILNFYKSDVQFNDDYIKETYTVLLDDSSSSVNTFFRIVAPGSDAKSVTPFELTFHTEEKNQKNKL